MVLLLVPLLAYAALPIVLRFAVPEILAARGVPASVGWGYLDLRDLELILSDLRIGPAGGPGITFDEVRADLVRDALARGRIDLTNLRLRGASLDLDALGEARMPDAGAGVPFEQVQLNDLHLAGLSEKLGREVVVRNARLHRDTEQAGRGYLLEIDVDAGGAPLEIRGTLRDDAGARTLEGTLSTSGLPVRLLEPSPEQTPSAWSGSVYAVTDFTLRYERPARRTSLRATGSLHTIGAGVRLGGLAITRADSVWEGTLTLSGPAFSLPERIYFQGTLDASAAQVANAGESSSALVSGLRWEGIGGWHGVPVVAGEGSIEAIELVRAAAGTPALRVDLERVQLQATLDDAGRYHLEHLRVRSTRAEPAVADTEIRLQSLEARELHVASGGVRVEHLFAASLEAVAGGESGAWRWVAEGPVLDRVTVTPEAQAHAAGAVLESLRVQGPELGITALGADLKELRLGPRGRFEAGLASLDTLELRGGDGLEVRVRDLHGESLAMERDGALEAGALRAARIAGSRAARESWAVQGLAAGHFRFRSGATAAGEAELGTLVYRGEDGGVLEGAGLRALSFARHAGGSGEAGHLEAESLRYEASRGASWDARVLSLAGVQWGERGPRSATRAVAAELRHRGTGGERWRFDALDLGPATLGAEGEARIGNATSERATLVLSSGEVLEGRGLRSGAAGRDAGGTARLAKLELEALGLRAPSGLSWRALPVEVESLAFLDGGQVDARRLRSAELSLHDGEGGRWQTKGVEAQRLEYHLSRRRLKVDPLELERLEFAAAGGFAWRAESLLAGAFDWPLGRVPRSRHASAAVLEGSAAPGLSWRLEDLQATGDDDPDAEPSRFRVSSAGAGEVESVAGGARFSWSGLRIADLQVAGAERFGAGRVVFGDVSLSGGLRSAASVASARMEVEALEREGRRLRAETVTLDDSVSTLGVNEAGEWMLPALPVAARAGGAFAVEVGTLGTGGHGRAVFMDRSVEPSWKAEIEPYRLRITGLDSLDPQRAARLEVEGTLDASARLEVRGELRAARQGFDVRAEGRLRDLDLVRLSDHARRHLGVVVHAGEGDLDFDLALSGGEVEAAGDLVLRDPTLEPAPSAGATGAALAEALRRLAGSGETVELRVSLHGPIADPGFDFAAAAGRAILRSAGLDPGTEAGESASGTSRQ